MCSAAGLDPEGVPWIRTFLRGQARLGRTVLVSSHQLAEMAQTVDDVAIVHSGRLVVHAPPADLTAGGTRTLEDAFFALTSPERSLS